MKAVGKKYVYIGEVSVAAVQSARNIDAIIDKNVRVEAQGSNVCRSWH